MICPYIDRPCIKDECLAFGEIERMEKKNPERRFWYSIVVRKYGYCNLLRITFERIKDKKV